MKPWRRRILTALAGLAVLATGYAVWAYLALTPRVSASGLRAEIRRELPVGTPRKQVEAWLQSRGMRWHDVVTLDGKRIGLGGDVEHLYRVEGFGDVEMDFAFYFDEQDNLASFTVRKF